MHDVRVRGVGDRGFALAELLVVVGIVMILMGLLLPVLKQARAAAEAVRCKAHLQQIGAMVAMYAGENRGQLFVGGPPVSYTDADWLTLLMSRSGRGQGGTEATLRCPTWGDKLGPSYPFNWMTFATGARLGSRFPVSGAVSSEVILVGENAPNNLTPYNAMIAETSEGYRLWSADPDRHGRQKSNHLRMDFSVTAEPARRFAAPFDSWFAR